MMYDIMPLLIIMYVPWKDKLKPDYYVCIPSVLTSCKMALRFNVGWYTSSYIHIDNDALFDKTNISTAHLRWLSSTCWKCQMQTENMLQAAVNFCNLHC